jgi:ArsR family transcriptional regulator
LALSAGPATVSELIEATGAGRTTVSQHLAKLRLSGFVDARKAGRNVIYSIHDDHLNQLIEEVLNYTGTRLAGDPPRD